MIFAKRSSKEKEALKYHISDSDYYWLASRFCQNMMAFVFSAARYNEDGTIYFEYFFLDFLDRRGIAYTIRDINEHDKQLYFIKPWEKQQ
ncbi:MAG: hypothetical protein ACXVIG_00270 [Halobacteriota archaeon]